MQRLSLLRIGAPLLGLLVVACDSASDSRAPTGSSDVASGSPPSPPSGSAAAIPHSLSALPGKGDAVPVITRSRTVLLETTAGDVTVEVYPEAAPNAAERFIELVESGFYDDTPISRVVPDFVAQFGVNWREPHEAWRNRTFPDDPTLFALERGTLAFAKAGPDTNSTQVFINYSENNRLADPQYNFTVFGKVVDGMGVVDDFVQVGDPSGGLDQARLWSDGAAYLESLETKPTMIERAVVR